MVALPANFRETRKPQLFEGLTEANLNQLLRYSVMQDYGPGKVLVQQGETPTGMYLVIEGTVKTMRINDEGEEAVIRMLEPGSTCMEAVLFMNAPSPITVQTITPAKLLLFPERIVKGHVLADSQFAVNLLQIVTHHYKNAMHQIDAMKIKSPLQRVGYYFLHKHLLAGHHRLEFVLPFRKQTIANYLGMTPETFSRTLKQMKAMGIEVSEDRISLRDSFALCHFCDADTAALCPHSVGGACSDCPRSAEV